MLIVLVLAFLVYSRGLGYGLIYDDFLLRPTIEGEDAIRAMFLTLMMQIFEEGSAIGTFLKAGHNAADKPAKMRYLTNVCGESKDKTHDRPIGPELNGGSRIYLFADRLYDKFPRLISSDSKKFRTIPFQDDHFAFDERRVQSNQQEHIVLKGAFSWRR
jgi:hypothetical protein